MITQSEAIIVLDARPSSVKFSLYAVSLCGLKRACSGQAERRESSAHLTVADDQGVPLADEPLLAMAAPDCSSMIEHVLEWLQSHFQERMSLVALGHRIAHGGAAYVEPLLLTQDVLETLQTLVPLAPLQQPHHLTAVSAAARLWPELPQVGCFDTAFHRGRPRAAECLGLPVDLLDQGLKRWGFHGLSYESVALEFSRLAPHVASGRVIVARLGASASLCAMKNGRSLDTTAGFSALDGLPMSTSCGALDPAIVLRLLEHMNRDQVEDLLYRRSGLLGLSEISGDMRTLLRSPDPRAAAAVDYFIYRVIREIGSLAAAAGGLDALVFTKGIGTNEPSIRAQVCRGLAWLGITLDPAANERHEPCISPPGRCPSVWITPADEQQMIAQHTWRIVSRLPQHLGTWQGGHHERAVKASYG